MPVGNRPPERRLPALDGLRALAVALVMCYHGGVAGLGVAGFYGVDVFFVLSGFLITGLLLEEQGRQGRIRLGAFWGRRARRLLPGLLVMLAAVDVYVAYVSPAGRYPAFRGDALSVVAYMSNWHFVATSSNYFSATGIPSLLTHTWSLAIEEQFYLCWPLTLWVVARLARRVGVRPAGPVLLLSGFGTLASAGWMAFLYREGASVSRLYYGTDTHAQSILAGAALAALAALRPALLEKVPAPLALTALAGMGWAVCTLGASDPLSYQGGFLLVAALTAVLVAGLVGRPAAVPARIFSLTPLAYLGRISYGMYLWYFPLFQVLDRSATGLSGAGLFALRCAADVGVAAASFHLLEQPVRAWRRSPRPFPVRLSAGLAAVAVVASLVVADTPPAPPAAAAPAAVTSTVPDGPGFRVLVIGDSTGATLGMDLAFPPVDRRFGLVIDDQAVYGCGVVISTEVREHGQAEQPPAECRTGSPPSVLFPEALAREMAAFHPDVVFIAAGRWEVTTRRPGPGQGWEDITEPADAAAVRSRLEAAASEVVVAGARLALATAPCYASGEQPDGSPWPEDAPARVQAYNSLVHQVAASHPGRATVVNMYGLVCPGGRFRSSIGGVTVRAPDGVHYPYFTLGDAGAEDPDTAAQAEAFGQWLAARIVPLLVQRPSPGREATSTLDP